RPLQRAVRGERTCRLRGSWGRVLACSVRGDAAAVAAVLAVATSSRVLGLSSAVRADGEVTRVLRLTLPLSLLLLQIPTRVIGTGISVGTGSQAAASTSRVADAEVHELPAYFAGPRSRHGLGVVILRPTVGVTGAVLFPGQSFAAELARVVDVSAVCAGT